MNDREEWRERIRDIRATSATWWWWYIYIYIYNESDQVNFSLIILIFFPYLIFCFPTSHIIFFHIHVHTLHPSFFLPTLYFSLHTSRYLSYHFFTHIILSPPHLHKLPISFLYLRNPFSSIPSPSPYRLFTHIILSPPHLPNHFFTHTILSSA